MAIGKARSGRAAGFTLPLTMALAFSLMALASGVVGMVLVSDKQAKAAASETVTRTSLESAVEASLFDLEENGEPQALEWSASQTVNGRAVAVTLADARYKPDVNNGAVEAVAGAIADAGLSARTLAALSPTGPDPHRPLYARFVDFAAAAHASPAEEDCLRRRLTIGRRGETAPAPPATAFAPPRTPLAIGAVIDVRAELRDWEGRTEVLWRRARFTGRPELPWLTHDWRQLRLGRRAEPDCSPPQVAASVSNALRPGP